MIFLFLCRKFMLGCLNDKYSLNLSALLKFFPDKYLYLSGKKVQICHQHNVYRTVGQFQSHLLSKLHIKMLTKAGGNGNLRATPSTCL